MLTSDPDESQDVAVEVGNRVASGVTSMVVLTGGGWRRRALVR
jgi:hypothetical protein